MEKRHELWPRGPCFYYDTALFPPGTDSFLLSALPRLRPGLRVCDLGCGTGLVGFLLLQRQRDLSLTGVDREERAVALARREAAKIEKHRDIWQENAKREQEHLEDLELEEFAIPSRASDDA